MPTRTLAQLRTSVLRRGSWEGSDDLLPDNDPSMMNEFINEAIRELWDLMIQKWEDYYTTEATLATVAGNDSIALPATFYKFRKLEILASGTLAGVDEHMIRLMPHDLEASHRFRSIDGKRYRYRIQGGALRLVPRPQAVETLRLFYIPYATELAADGDTFDGINGYEELAIQFAMMRVEKRQDLPIEETMREIDRLTKRIRTAADGRDAAEPMYLDPAGPPNDTEDDEP